MRGPTLRFLAGLTCALALARPATAELRPCARSYQGSSARYDYGPDVPDPESPPGRGPRLLYDQEHRNIHCLLGSYLGFYRTLEADGYRISALYDAWTAESLEAADVFVVVVPSSAPTLEERQVLTHWVAQGGRLLLITDHPPYPAYLQDLADDLGLALHGQSAETRCPPDDDGCDARRFQFPLADPRLFPGVEFVTTYEGVTAVPKPDTFARSILTFDSLSPVAPELQGHSQGLFADHGKGGVYLSGDAGMFSTTLVADDVSVRGLGAPDAPYNELYLRQLLHFLAEYPVYYVEVQEAMEALARRNPRLFRPNDGRRGYLAEILRWILVRERGEGRSLLRPRLDAVGLSGR